MSVIMFAATLALTLSGVGFAGTYLWLNLFSSLPELDSRSKSALKIAKISMILSLIFAFLTALITDVGAAAEAIGLSHILFTVIAISYLVVSLACGAAMIFSVISRHAFRRNIGTVVGRMFLVSLICGIVALILAWLLG